MDTHMKTSIHRSVVSLKLPDPIGLLISVVKAILIAMTGNTHFPNPTPTLATVDSAVSDLEKAEATAQSRVKGATETRNAKRAALLLLVDALASYVQTIADADPGNGAAIIQSAGMGVRKTTVHGKRVFGVIQGSLSGSVKVVAPSAARRASYDWQWSTDGGKTWQLAASTLQAKTSLTGFAAGSTVSFRYRVTTKTGEAEWSQPIAFLVK
jgi:hypothetical protein